MSVSEDDKDLGIVGVILECAVEEDCTTEMLRNLKLFADGAHELAPDEQAYWIEMCILDQSGSLSPATKRALQTLIQIESDGAFLLAFDEMGDQEAEPPPQFTV